MRPRLLLDISYADLASVFAPSRKISSASEYSLSVPPIIFKSAIICLSARSAFHALLKTLSLPPAAPIIYSAITIETMVAIAQEHGLTHGLATHFVDIDPATMLPSAADLDALLTKTGAKVVVIAQLFGCVSSLKAHGDVCKKHGALLVEDCAQAFSGDFHVGDSAADFSLFSFGPIKRFTALGGGIIIGKDQLVLDKIAHTIHAWPRKADAWFLQRTLKFLALKLASTPLVYTALMRSLSALGKDADALIGSIARGFQAGRITPQLEFQPSTRQRRLLFRRLNVAKHSKSRSEAAAQILQTVQKLIPHIAFETLGNAAHKNAYWLMPVLVTDSVTEPANIVIQLRQFGIDATQGATSMRAFGPDCPQAQRIMRQVVYLPL